MADYQTCGLNDNKNIFTDIIVVVALAPVIIGILAYLVLPLILTVGILILQVRQILDIIPLWLYLYILSVYVMILKYT